MTPTAAPAVFTTPLRWRRPGRSCWARRRIAISLVLTSTSLCLIGAEVSKPTDAPEPLSPSRAQKSFQLPPGFRIELVASEPLISEPTGVCWDERGQLYVCELHGYNLEGQLEIEEMNKSGTLDTKVQRVQAAEKFKQQAQLGTYGVVKRLFDINRDGIMDAAQVLASNLPPAYGICPARGGLVVAGQAEIVFIADHDNDGVAEVKDTLFQGWKSGALERGINAPQWGPDGWIYFGRGWGSDQITGPHLKKPVHLPNTDFRIRADGSAIEPVGAGTHTIGLAFTPDGTRFFTTTWKHALYGIPIDWRYFERNPDAAAPSLEADASDYTTVFPISPIHPWKQARSSLPGWKELYAGYGLAESAASGYFTSCCSPLVYQSSAFPMAHQGNLFVCEPAQNLVHRSVIEPDGPALRVRRAADEDKREFLASSDSWFRPVSLAHAPDGSVVIVDMYREIIEDYSAVPRFMQQQYGLSGGVRHGRIWRLTFVGETSSGQGPDTDLPTSSDLSVLDDLALAEELKSSNFWRCQTAERLLRERRGDQAPALAQERGHWEEVFKLLDSGVGLTIPGPLNSDGVRVTQSPETRLLKLLRSHDQILSTNAEAAKQLAARIRRVTAPRVLLQLALSLGYSREPEAFDTLAYLAREHSSIRWMPAALMTGMHGRAGRMLSELLRDSGKHGHAMIEPLASCIAAGNNEIEMSDVLITLASVPSEALRAAGLKGFQRVKAGKPLTAPAVAAIQRLLNDESTAVRGLAVTVAKALKLGNPPALSGLRQEAAHEAADPNLPTEKRLAAIALLASSDDPGATAHLQAAWPSATPGIRAALFDAFVSRAGRIATLVDAFESDRLSPSSLSAAQRSRLLERADSHQRPRLEAILARAQAPEFEPIYQRYVAALNGPRDPARGADLFQQLCANCHQVAGVGIHVGPNLSQAFQRSEHVLVRDLLAPSDSMSSGYETYRVTLKDGDEVSGILVSDSATSVTLRTGGGVEQSVLRKDIAQLRSSTVSLMPDGMAEVLTPQDCASLLTWLRTALQHQTPGIGP